MLERVGMRFQRDRASSPIPGAVLLAAVLFGAGCEPAGPRNNANPPRNDGGPGKDKAAGKTPPTPRAAMLQFAEGVCTGDEGKVFGAARADDRQKEFLRALL